MEYKKNDQVIICKTGQHAIVVLAVDTGYWVSTTEYRSERLSWYTEKELIPLTEISKAIYLD